MIIKFSNLGAIKETELDLRPLTVIIGPNNSNKTYIAYSVYGLWKHYRLTLSANELPIYRTLSNEVLMNLDSEFENWFIDAIKLNIRGFIQELRNYFQDSSNRLFSNTFFEIQASLKEVKGAIERVVSQKVLESFAFEYSWVLRIDDNVLSIHREDTNVPLRGPVLTFTLFQRINKQIFARPFLLPAERNAFVLTYKLLANRRYKIMREAQRGTILLDDDEVDNKLRRFELLREQGDILYPQPIEDFWDFLTDLEFQQNARIKPDHKNEFQLLADYIEERIQNKNRTVLTSTKFGGKEIKVNVKKGLSIDLYNASSSIKQLAPLLLYLRYRAAENDLLIIDEPEMGLHPESQAKLLEALAILVNLGVKVLLTTHSPYFMSHLNNLVQNNNIDADAFKKLASSLYLNDPRAFLKMDQVSAYEMKDNKLRTLKDEEYGIRWDTLSDVSAEIQQKYFEISEKREKLRHGRKK